MKKLLLTSALVAVSGAALAEVTVGGRAEIGYNTHVEGLIGDDVTTFTDKDGNEQPIRDSNNNEPIDGDAWVANDDNPNNPTGIYSDVTLRFSGTQELDNGLSFSVDYEGSVEYANAGDDGDGTEIDWDDFPTLTFESSAGSLVLGDTDHAAHELFNRIGGSDAEFTEDGDEMVLRVDTALMGQTVGISYTADDPAGADLPKESWTLGFVGDYNGIRYSAGYEQDGDTDDEVFGIQAGYEFMRGFIVDFGYITGDNQDVEGTGSTADIDSYGLGIGYDFGAFDVEGFVAQNDIDNVEGGALDYDSYAGYGIETNFTTMGADFTLGYENTNDREDDSNGFYGDAEYTIEQYGLTLFAGYDETENVILADSDRYGEEGAGYVGLEYALGGGASLVASYAEADEIDPAENFHAGTTLAVALDF